MMMMEHLPRPWYLAAVAGLSIGELLHSEQETQRDRQARRLGRRCERKGRRPGERRRRAPHFARHQFARA
jgi:hypothetical protein